MKRFVFAFIVSVVLFSSSSYAKLCAIDLSRGVPDAQPTFLGQGINVNPDGDIITADNRSFFFNGKPWMPVSGEFHYSRYPAEQWRDELLKIKAGGVTVVPTYVFWIHHQETPGEFNWSGRRNLRKFIQLCDELGLMVIVRMGPWCHGEVRNGGLPDWVQNSGVKLRTKDPMFLDMVRPLYSEIAKQVDGLLWKDGGPIIGVQHDNERNDVPYLLELKKMARELGVDVPLYTMTGWNRVNIPSSELLPLFGAYSVAFWYPHSNTNYRKSFFFSDIRDDGDMGAQFVNKRPQRVGNIMRYPYVCCEIGGGMPSSYKKRVFVYPDEIAAMSLVRLGCGSNMQGYYMYHGGYNPDGITWLNESKPNAMPVKDYDFQAPLGAFGQVRDHYFLLRQQHMFIDTFQGTLARMPLFLPEELPAGLDDNESVRFAVRSDGDSGFIFINNYQPDMELPEKKGVQFVLNTADNKLTVPAEPITIGSGSYGIMPFNLDCDGVMLEYGTVQPVCRIENDKEIVWFFSALPGIASEMQFKAVDSKFSIYGTDSICDDDILRLKLIVPGSDFVASAENSTGKRVNFSVLPYDQAKYLSKININGKEHVVVSKSVTVEDNASYKFYCDNEEKAEVLIYPSPSLLIAGGKNIPASQKGIFTHYNLASLCLPSKIEAKAVCVSNGDMEYGLDATSDRSWDSASTWDIDLPDSIDDDKIVLKINYIGDAARLYVDDDLYLDNYYNGKPMEFGLWDIPPEKRSELKLKIMPYSPKLESYFPVSVVRKINEVQARGGLTNVSIDVQKQNCLEISIK